MLKRIRKYVYLAKDFPGLVDGYYFATERETLNGPHKTAEMANLKLDRYTRRSRRASMLHNRAIGQGG